MNSNNKFDPIIQETIGSLLSTWRGGANLTREELSEKCRAMGKNIHPNTIASWEKSNRIPKPLSIVTLLLIFKVRGVEIPKNIFDISLKAMTANQKHDNKNNANPHLSLIQYKESIFDKAVQKVRAELKKSSSSYSLKKCITLLIEYYVEQIRKKSNE